MAYQQEYNILGFILANLGIVGNSFETIKETNMMCIIVKQKTKKIRTQRRKISLF